MPNLVISIGVLLIALGGYSYFGSISRSTMTLIPGMLGAVIVVCGLLALKEHLRKHAMHGAAAFALLGVIGGIGPLAMGGTSRFPPLMIQATTGMMILSGLLLAVAVRSMIMARRANTQE
ncbi:MAG: hypothetical protein AAF384_04440 [Pseudomonadota bacterium]